MRVEISPTALAQITEIEAWWSDQRPRAATLFTDELEAAISRLSELPRLGAVYPAFPGVRRLLLPRTGYHVYTTEDETVVRIVAVWSAIRASGPRL